jgi:hypothetical protein
MFALLGAFSIDYIIIKTKSLKRLKLKKEEING